MYKNKVWSRFGTVKNTEITNININIKYVNSVQKEGEEKFVYWSSRNLDL